MQKINTIENSDPKFLIDKADIISFDIFDTAVLRPFLHHNEMYYILEHILKYPKFHNVRIKAEQFTRKELIPKSKEEITLLDVYEHINVDTQKAVNAEIALDIAMSFQRKFVFDLYQYAINIGKRVIFVSDITYPRKAVEKILYKNGYSVFEKLYVSAEDGLSKHQGGLYEKILFETKLNPRKILHIGDSLKADIHKANEYGIRTFYIPRPYHNITTLLNEKYFQLRKNLTNSCLFGIISNVLFDDPSNIKNTHPVDIYTIPFIFKLAKNISKTQNNIFITDNTTPQPFFDIFSQVYQKFDKTMSVIHININYLYAASVYKYEDIKNLQQIVPHKEFLLCLKTMYGIADETEIEQEWHNIEITSLKIRRQVTTTLKHLPQSTVYSATDHPYIQEIIYLILQKEIKHFINIRSACKIVIQSSLKNPLFKKFDIDSMVENIHQTSDLDVQEKFIPQINYLFTVIEKYIELL